MGTELTILGKLETTEENYLKLKNTIRVYREVCNYISGIAYEESCFNHLALHHLTYKNVRSKYKIPANFAVRARDKVVLTYKKNAKKLHVFKSLSIDLDNRLFSLSENEEVVVVSIATINKRIKSKLLIDQSQKHFLKHPIVKAKLKQEGNIFLLNLVVRVNYISNITE